MKIEDIMRNRDLWSLLHNWSEAETAKTYQSLEGGYCLGQTRSVWNAVEVALGATSENAKKRLHALSQAIRHPNHSHGLVAQNAGVHRSTVRSIRKKLMEVINAHLHQ